MAEILEKILTFLKTFWPLFVVLPWESAVRARGGKHLALLGPGVHFRLPFFDTLQVVNTRLRIVHTEAQTLTTADGHALVVALTLGFRIVDPMLATMVHHVPEWTVRSIATGDLADFVTSRGKDSVRPALIAAHVLGALRARGSGYEYDICSVTECGFIRTIRLLQTNGSPYSPGIGDRSL